MYRCIADLMRNGSRYHSHAKNPIQMLSFGVGLTKTLGALIEQQGPAGPFVWPRGLSPYRAIVIVRETHPSLDTLRVDQRVLVDDRPISVGRRIKEAEWFGVPYLAVAHHDGIELVDRVAGRTVHRIAIDEFFTRIQ
jgi:prolyl-tRNA synthetase